MKAFIVPGYDHITTGIDAVMIGWHGGAMTGEEALKKGMEEKSEKFVAQGAKVYSSLN